MRTLVINDERGHVVAVVGSQQEFGMQVDTAAMLASAPFDKMAWVDWIQARRPGMGTELMRALLTQLEADGVSLVGLEACAATEAQRERLSRFYEKFGFVDVSPLVPHAEYPVFLRDAGWNGME